MQGESKESIETTEYEPEHVLGIIPVDLKRDRTKVKLNILSTHDGHKLTIRQMRFIENYINSGGKLIQAFKDAGYSSDSKHISQAANKLLHKSYVYDEIQYQIDQLRTHNIADREEILEYFTAVMRGEVKDQFGLDAPLGERTDAAKELAKRIIDPQDKLQGKQEAQVTITLDWSRDPNDENVIATIPAVSD